MANENERINISLGPEIAKQLRHAAIEKYGNSRSLSKLIEDMAKGLDNKNDKIDKIAEVEKNDIEGIKAARQKCVTDFCNDMDSVFFRSGNYLPVCGALNLLFQTYRCKVCDAEFETIFPDGKYCPSCRSDVIRIPTDENRFKKRVDDDAFGAGAKKRCSIKVLNYILDKLKAGHDTLLLSDVAAKFETEPKIIKDLLSPLGIEAQKNKKGGKRYFSQDARNQIETILNSIEHCDSNAFISYLMDVGVKQDEYENDAIKDGESTISG